MTEFSPILSRLIAELDSTANPPGLLSLAEALQKANLTLSDVAPWVGEGERTYHRASVVRRERYELLVITWRRGQGSPPHDHAGSVAAMKVVAGKAVEETYVLNPDGYSEHVETSSLPTGALTAWQDAGVHAIRNPGNELLVTVNVYAPPLNEFRRFAVASTESPRPTPTHPSRETRTVVVVGGGFSGTMTAAQLIRQAKAAGVPLRVVIVERRGTIGEGVAYGTPEIEHLLNVPAGRMSAWSDRPADFVDWVSRVYGPVSPGTFAPRAWYGRYVRERLHEVMTSPGTATCDTLLDEVCRVTRRPDQGWVVHFARSPSIVANDVVLAIGHRPPSDPLAQVWNGSRSRFVSDPWKPFALSSIPPNEPVAILGSGLTATDALFSLGMAARSAPVWMISRRGWTPRAHADIPAAAADLTALAARWKADPDGIRATVLFRDLRRAVEDASTQGGDWRSVVDGLRPHTADLWRAASRSQRERFLRHVRPFWETVRHRMAPQIARQFELWQQQRRVRILSGRVESAVARDKGISLYIRERRADLLTPLEVGWVVNCTGPTASNRPDANPVIASLMLQGWLSTDELSLGVRTSENGVAIDRAGEWVNDLRIVGTLRKPATWESTAVPELRIQAEVVARDIIDKYGRAVSRASDRAFENPAALSKFR